MGGGGIIYTYRYTVITRVPGEIKRSRDLRGGRWSWTLNCGFAPAEIMSREVELPLSKFSGRLLLRVVQVVRQQQCNGHCLSDSVQPAQQLKQQLRSAQVAGPAMARGHRLNT